MAQLLPPNELAGWIPHSHFEYFYSNYTNTFALIFQSLAPRAISLHHVDFSQSDFTGSVSPQSVILIPGCYKDLTI